jgi:aspartate/methionine/tyrosine aminotransferase
MIGSRYRSSAEVADEMLSLAHIAVTDGAGFGADGFLRLSYATSMENLQTAVERLGNLMGAAAAQPA